MGTVRGTDSTLPVASAIGMLHGLALAISTVPSLQSRSDD